MNQFEMVVAIVIAVMIASVIKARYKFRNRDGDAPVANAETERLREDVARLKDRLAVLERITLEKENSLAREIDDLRNR
jgi:hypothetical protein